LGEDEDINGVIIEPECVFKETVIGGIHEARVEHTIEKDAPRFVVNFVLIVGSTGDFNDGGVIGHKQVLLRGKAS
jgi:hypothetical protein